MIFESINTNELGYIIAPSDISPGNVWNLATPELEESSCIQTTGSGVA